MLDGRILAAVLASLTAVAAAVSGGGLTTEDISESTVSAPGDLSFSDIKPDSLGIVDRFIEKPKPENEMKAVLVSDNLADERFKIKDSRVSSSDFRSIEFSGKTLESEDSIELYGFTGNLRPGNGTER